MDYSLLLVIENAPPIERSRSNLSDNTGGIKFGLGSCYQPDFFIRESVAQAQLSSMLMGESESTEKKLSENHEFIEGTKVYHIAIIDYL